MGRKENNRFQIVLEETNAVATGSKILKDTETGVLYFFHYSGYAGGITLLVDKDGNPIIEDGDSN